MGSWDPQRAGSPPQEGGITAHLSAHLSILEVLGLSGLAFLHSSYHSLPLQKAID